MKSLSQREAERQKAADAPFKFAQDLKANLDDYLKKNPQGRAEVRVDGNLVEIISANRKLVVGMQQDGITSIEVCGVLIENTNDDVVLDAVSRFLSYCASTPGA
jgi:hypothetical protein